MTEAEARAQQAALLAIYGPTPQDRQRVGFPHFTYPGAVPPPLAAGWLPGLAEQQRGLTVEQLAHALRGRD